MPMQPPSARPERAVKDWARSPRTAVDYKALSLHMLTHSLNK